MLDRALNALDWLGFRLRIGLDILRRLPLVKCPACGGEGGAMEGYFEPEWESCQHCSKETAWLDEHEFLWFIGRVHPLRWPHCWFRWRTGQGTITGWLLCKAGIHVTGDDGFCRRCYELEEPEKEAPDAR